MTRALISLGSNLKNPHAQVAEAIASLRSHFPDILVSDFYLTQPVGPIDQAEFVNAAVSFDTALTALALFEILADLENRAGRERMIPQGPRVLDLDVILFGSEIINTPRLQIPHPRFRERKFVLVPAAQIEPDMIDPVSGRSMDRLLKECRDMSWIKSVSPEAVSL